MKKFENPELEIVKLALLDVITSSGGNVDEDLDVGPNMGGWH